MTGVLSLLAGGLPTVAADEAARGYDLYLFECSKCHGSMEVAGEPGEVRQHIHLALAGQVAEYRCTSDHPLDSPLHDTCANTPPRFAFALPFGPNLAGILGRRAGTIAGYEYSSAFMEAFSESIWDEELLDQYIEDSQLLAPGIRMYYRQPDAEIRRSIIDFLRRRP